MSNFSNLVSKEFEEAGANVSLLKEDHGNEVKLKLYSLYKQVFILTKNKTSKNCLNRN